MVAINNITVDNYEFRATSSGVAETVAKTKQLAAANDAVGSSGEKVERRLTSMEQALERQGRQAAMAAKANQDLARGQASLEQQFRAAEASALTYQRGIASLTAREGELAAMQQRGAAANGEMTGSLDRVGSAFASAGKFAISHPILVAAGAAASARYVGIMSASVGASLASAAAATGRFANDNQAMGGRVAAAAAVAARALSLTSAGATTAAAGLATFADKASTLTTGAGLMSRVLGFVGPVLGAIGIAFSVFKLGSDFIDKATADLAKLVDVGKAAERLDISAPFLKSFTGLGAKLRIEVGEMDAAIQRASSFVQDRHGQQNALGKLFDDLRSGGYTGGGQFGPAVQLDAARTTEEKIKAAIAGMVELERIGQRFAALNVAETVFGSALTDRLRTGKLSIAEMAADLEAASQKQILRQEDVTRALELSRNLEDVRRNISEALAVTLDFSTFARGVDEAWLAVLRTVLAIVEAINSAIAAAGGLLSKLSDGVTDAMTKLGNAKIWDRIYDAAKAAGLTNNVVELAPPGGFPLAIKVQPPIGSRSGTEIFGPPMPKPETSKAAAAAAKEAASAYDTLIQRTKDRIEELDLEASMVGKTTDAVIKLKLAHDLERAAKKSGEPVTAEMRAEWEQLGTTLAASTKRLSDAKREFDAIRESQRALGDAFSTFVEGLLTGSGKISDAAASLGKTFTSGGLQAILTGQGPFAGALGMAPSEKGGLGGLLDPQFFTKIQKSFQSGFSGSLRELQGPTQTGEPLGATGSSFNYGGVASAGLGLVAAYGAGTQAKSPLLGAASGALAGAVGGSQFGPIGSVGGAVAGGLLGIFGASSAKKQQERQKKFEAFSKFADALPDIQALQLNLNDVAQGDLSKTISDAKAKVAAAQKVVLEAGLADAAVALGRDQAAFIATVKAAFAATFAGMLDALNSGFGPNGPAVQAEASIVALGETLRGFVADTVSAYDGNADKVAQATVAARNAALASLSPAPVLSAIATRFEEIRGTAAGLDEVLAKLGVTGEDAGRQIAAGVQVALDQLRGSFLADLERKTNAAQDRDYLNSASDLVGERRSLLGDAALLGAGSSQVETYFAAAAQKIVDEAQLVGGSFADLTGRFPDLVGRVHEYSAALADSAGAADAAKKAEEDLAARRLGYQDRTFAAGLDTNTEGGALAAFDRQAGRGRAEEAKAGGQALADLEQALAAERLGIVKDFATRAADAAKQAADEQARIAKEAADEQARIAEASTQRQATFADRAFAAANDNTTLEGSLAAFDRTAARERAEEAKAGGQALLELEVALASERTKVETDFAARSVETAKAAAEEQAQIAAATAQRATGLADRLLTSGLDTATLTGSLLAQERQFQREREEEVRQGGELLLDLERAQLGDRLRTLQDYADRAAEAEKARFDQAREAFETLARSIKEFVAGLKTGSGSPLSPQARLAAAQAQYATTLSAAQGGNREALNSITGVASTLLDAAKGYYASSSAFQAVFEQVSSQLTSLPDQVSAEQFIVDAIDAGRQATVDALTLTRATLQAALAANSPGLIASALTASFDRLDTSVNGLLDFGEFLAGVGPLATKQEQATARSIFDAIDANGDGAISKLEAVRAGTVAVEGQTAGVVAQTNATREAAILANTLAQARQVILGSQDANLGTIIGTTNNTAAQAAATAQQAANAAAQAAATKDAVNYQTGIVDSQSAILAGQRVVLDAINFWTNQTRNAVDYQTGFVNAANAIANGQSSVLDAINFWTNQTRNAVDYQTGFVAVANEIANGQRIVLDAANAIATGQRSVLDAINYWTEGTRAQVANSNNILNAINGLSSLQIDQLKALKDQFSLNAALDINGVAVNNNMVTALNKIVYNTALSDQARNNLSGRFATGGWVTGPGTGTSDSIRAMLSNGEFVMPAASARMFGPVLEEMRAGRMPVASMPVPVPYMAGNDNGAVVSMIARLIDRIGVLEANLVAAETSGAQHVREGVDGVRSEQRRANADATQQRLAPRRAGTRAAG